MKQYYLTEIMTKDKLLHQGIYFEPRKKNKKAILWMHGLSASFYAGIPLFDMVTDSCQREGWGFAHFNSRGHDLIAGVRKIDGTPPYGYSYYPAGAGQEVFEESVLDIEAGIEFLVRRGFPDIVLVGHSTGANKACYFAATRKNPSVVGVVLSGPISDRLSLLKNSNKLPEILEKMHALVDEGRGDELMVGYHFFPITPQRFISLFEPRTNEDVFDYGEPEPHLKYFSEITIPLLVQIGGDDEATDRPVQEIIKEFDSHATARVYKSVIIPNALHRYTGHEREAVASIVGWINTI